MSTGPAAALTVETVSGSDLLGAGAMPAVNEHAVSAVGGPAGRPAVTDGATVRPDAPPPGPVRTFARDGNGRFTGTGGRPHGPSLPVNGAVDPGGPEHLASGGSSVPERILRPPTATPAPAPPGQPEPGQSSTAVPLEVMPPMNGAAHELEAETALRSFYHVTDTVMASDGEWQPDDLNEHESLKAVLVAWRKATNGKPLPPWLAFVLSALTFIFKRVRRPKTKKRLVSWFPDMAPGLGVEIPRPAKSSSEEKPDPGRPPGPVFSTDISAYGRRPAA